MRRFLIYWAILTVEALAGLGQLAHAADPLAHAWPRGGAGVGHQAPSPVNGVADIRDYGALPGPENATATRKAIQAAIDSKAPVVFIPPDPAGYYDDRPVFTDWSGQSLRGQGSYLKGLATNDLVVVAGVPRRPNGVALDPAAIVPSGGVLDGSAQGRVGLALKGTHLGQQWGGFSGARGRWDVGQFAADFCADLARCTGDAMVLGWGAGSARHFSVACQGDSLYVRFNCSDGPRSFYVPVDRSHPSRVSIQVDAAAASVQAYVDRVQVALQRTAGFDWRPDPARTLKGDITAPFAVGVGLDTGPFGPSETWGNPADCTLYGLRLGTSLLYLDSGPGRRQQWRPGAYQWADLDNSNGAIPDANLYFNAAVGTRVYLPLQDAPADVAGDRLVRVRTVEPDQGGSINDGWAMVLDNAAHGSLASTVQGLTLDGLNLVSGSPYGSTLTVGICVDFTFRNSSVSGGTCGLGSWDVPGGNTWTTRLYHDFFSGSYAAVHLAGNLIAGDDLTVRGAGFTAFDLPRCGASLGDLFVFGFGTPDHIFRGSGQLVLRGEQRVDYEDGVYPRKSLIDWTSEGGNPQSQYVTWTRFIVGNTGPGCVFLDLHDSPRGANAAFVRPGDVDLIDGRMAAVIRCEGRSWSTADGRPVSVPAGMRRPGIVPYVWSGQGPDPMAPIGARPMPPAP
jgi:hypothetical protein